MPEFEHLSLVQVVERKPYIAVGGGSGKKDPQTIYNLQNRQQHYNNLTGQVATLKQTWQANVESREGSELPPLDNPNILPVFLQIDLSAKDIESLKSFGIDIISEEEDGFIIGANADDFSAFNDRLEQFLNQSNRLFKDSAASILRIVQEPLERLQRIVSPELFAKWESLEKEMEIVVYVAISSYLKTPTYPEQRPDQSDARYERTVTKWKLRYQQWEVNKDELAMQRQSAFENFIRPYNAIFVGTLSQYTDFEDGFCCKIRISGKGLKDLALNFPYVFNIEEHDPLLSFKGISELESLLNVEIISPDIDDPKVCIIDSGIQEQHRLLAPAIDGTLSISYVPKDNDTFDKVNGGGHGTRVAGATLFPNGIDTGILKLKAPFWIQNARILNHENMLSNKVSEADLMRAIVGRFKPTRIFNLSISNAKPRPYVHMPVWSATIDKVIWENDILFCIAAGNIPRESDIPDIPGILNYLAAGIDYPSFLKETKSQITNPAFSSFALVVGSICKMPFANDSLTSFAFKDYPSSFSRAGLGLWGMIKPDVVEYGGDFIINKDRRDTISTHPDICPNLIRSTRDNGPAMSREIVGTSFTTPKVTHIAAALQKLYPDEPCLLYRALIVQSARIPDTASNIADFIRHYGYGIPDIEKATANSEKRITFHSSNEVNPKNADIYRVKIPAEVRRPAYDFEVLIEITLSYKAEPRITRRRTQSYLSAWLDWETSRIGESLTQLSDRILEKNLTEEEGQDDLDINDDNTVKLETFKWAIGTKGKDGYLKGVKRQDSTVQKDWCIIKSNKLPEDFLIAVKGHAGWQKDLDQAVPYSVVVSFELLQGNIELYSLIREENRIETELEHPVEITVRR